MISSFSYIFFLYKYMVNKVNIDETYRYIPETLQIFPKYVSTISGWWFQSPWKILVKIGSFPQLGLKNNKIFETTT